jgi:BirA family biotin operon repressor/biotin-[acetyl-CoA-carboxylase] ligase
MNFELGPRARTAGYRIDQHDTVGSTNAEGLRHARHGDVGRLWIVSDHQTAGRGRRGNRWETPPGNLAASLLYIAEATPSTAATLGFVAGLALDEALRKIVPNLSVRIGLDAVEPRAVGAGDRLRLKWPNDVLLDGGKIGGILLEAEPVASGSLAVVVGIGVNVRSAPEGLPYPTAALATYASGVDAADIFYALSDAWTGLERLWAGGRGFCRIRDLWLTQAAGLGEVVTVRVGERLHRGIFDTIDDEGRLVIRSESGTTRLVSAGEVHFGAMAATARP